MKPDHVRFGIIEGSLTVAKRWLLVALCAAIGSYGPAARGLGDPAPVAAAAPAKPADDTILLTIFLKHDESKTLDQINQQLREQNFFKAFPPPGIEVVSWYVMMGIGQVVTLRVPASRLREVNRAVELTAWGAFRTEFYPTYDYKIEALKLHNAAQPK
jgi:hypothetical protein